jgi:hypothetical protein
MKTALTISVKIAFICFCALFLLALVIDLFRFTKGQSVFNRKG